MLASGRQTQNRKRNVHDRVEIAAENEGERAEQKQPGVEELSESAVKVSFRLSHGPAAVSPPTRFITFDIGITPSAL